jgi:hypothetical protein
MLSAYEMQRLETMKANQQMLESLGLVENADELRVKQRPAGQGSLSEEEKARRRQERQEAISRVPRRASGRLKELAEQGPAPASPKTFTSYDIDDDPPPLRRRRKRRHTVAAPELSEAQRSVLSGQSGWLEEMREFYATGPMEYRLSPDNLRNVMKVVERLVSGAGVVHPYQPSRVFQKNQPVGLDSDFVALKEAGNSFLRPEDDRSNGWRLNHPIGKCILFQRHRFRLLGHEGGVSATTPQRLAKKKPRVEPPKTIVQPPKRRSGATSAPSPLEFQIGSHVKAMDRWWWYDARVLSVSPPKTLVHYVGFKKSHDRWVSQAEIAPITKDEENGEAEQVSHAQSVAKAPKTDAPPARCLLVEMDRVAPRQCGTPQCTLPDFHMGPCSTWSVAVSLGRRARQASAATKA